MVPLGLKTNSALNIGELPTSCGLNCVWMKKHEYARRTKYLPQKYPSCPLNPCSLFQTPATRAKGQSLLRLAGSKLKQEKYPNCFCPLLPPLFPISALGFPSPRLPPSHTQGKCSGWPHKEGYPRDGIFLYMQMNLILQIQEPTIITQMKFIPQSGSVKIQGEETRKPEELGGL